jgi:hypothetical protein
MSSGTCSQRRTLAPPSMRRTMNLPSREGRLHDDGQVGVVRVLELGANAEVILFRVSQGEHDLAHDF